MANSVPDSQLEFNLGDDEVETSVSVAEDKEEDQGSVIEAEEQSSPIIEEPPQEPVQKSELDTVSDAVQKRISKLTAKMREAERREQAALEYARGIQAQANDLQTRLVQTDQSRLSETKTRMDTQQATLRAIIKRAREEGDIDTETEAQEKLSDLSYEQRRISEWMAQQQYQQEQQQQPQPQQQYQQPQQQPRQAPQAAPPSPKAEEWAARNEWFGKDRVLTYAAWGIHQSLTEEEGIDADTDEYYTELDNRLRLEFPQKLQPSVQTNRQRNTVPSVAPATRSSGINSARRTVRLSPSQVAIAKKLGVPLEEYAKYVKD
jgi:hypothetical protein